MKPLLITAANFALKDYVLQSMAAAKALGYELLVYDLGNLGVEGSIPFAVNDESFQKDGFYALLDNGRWKSRSLFKPSVVKHAMASRPADFIVWLDADAQVIRPIDDIAGDPGCVPQSRDSAAASHDIGVTSRNLTSKESWRWPNLGTNQFAGTNFASSTANGILFSNDWQTFNAKQAALTYQPATNGGPIAVTQLPYVPQPASTNLTNWSNIGTNQFLGTNALPVQGTNLANGGSSVGQISTATSSGVTWSNAPSGGASATRGTFTFSSLTNGVLTITHNLNLTAPFAVTAIIFNNSYQQILPDNVTGSANSVQVDITSYTNTMTGTWGWEVF
ncbi:MAG: hypothetical protein ABSD77_07810 [Verrucomicrobiota bacterium]|jgi:hypothetical protein